MPTIDQKDVSTPERHGRLARSTGLEDLGHGILDQGRESTPDRHVLGWHHLGIRRPQLSLIYQFISNILRFFGIVSFKKHQPSVALSL